MIVLIPGAAYRLPDFAIRNKSTAALDAFLLGSGV
jgi:hypothetical protein